MRNNLSASDEAREIAERYTEFGASLDLADEIRAYGERRADSLAIFDKADEIIVPVRKVWEGEVALWKQRAEAAEARAAKLEQELAEANWTTERIEKIQASLAAALVREERLRGLLRRAGPALPTWEPGLREEIREALRQAEEPTGTA